MIKGYIGSFFKYKKENESVAEAEEDFRLE
jgi:hypothetical protein